MARSLLLCTTLLSLYTARAESLRILKEKGFPVGLTANSEITVIEKGLDEMWHAYLHCKVKGMHIFVVHLSPSQHAFRMKEAKLLCEKAKTVLDAGETVLFLEEFNCNSPLDQKWLDALLLRDAFKVIGAPSIGLAPGIICLFQSKPGESSFRRDPTHH